MQLKAFNKSGGLIFDYSKGVPGYNREYFHGWLRDVYVDSLLIIYILGGASQDYLAVVDTAGNLIEKLSPYGDSSGVVVASTFFNSNDVITFLMYDKNYFTYMNGVFDEGGSPGWRAGDGYYYHANLIETNTFRFVKYEAPSITGQASNLQETIKVVDVPAAFDLHFLGVDDGMNLYVFETEQEEGKTRVLVFDTGFQLIDQIVFPDRGNRYLWYMNPFMRPSDGNIYEFRCLDDGLHVVRWSKQ